MTQKKTNPFIMLTLAILSLALVSGSMLICPAHAQRIELNEIRITTNTASQENPDIYYYGFNNYAVVWQDNRNGNWDIYVSKNAEATPTESRLTTNQANQIAPAISGSIVVYQDDRNGNWDIYMYNLDSQTETQITSNTASQINPDIDGNNIVWQDNRNGNWDIYTYDSFTHTEKRVTSSSSSEENPAISYNLIAYDKWITVNNIQRQAVFYYDLANNNETYVSTTGDTSHNPAIYNTCVVYESSRASELDTLKLMVMRDIVHADSWETFGAYKPDVNGNLIAYEDHTTWTESNAIITYHSDIWIFNIDSRVKTQITSDTKEQLNPKISGNHVVYMDNRNGNWEIYMTVIIMAIAGPTATNLPRLGAPGPGYTQSASDTFFNSSTTTAIIATVAVIAVIIASITLAVYYKKQKNEMKAKQTREET